MSESDAPCGSAALLRMFGRIDIYLFDQLLRGRITPEMRVLDAGCGVGRNAHHLLRCGAEVYGIDRDEQRIADMRALAAQLAPGSSPDNFRVGRITDLPFGERRFHAVICSAVLHFAEDETEFESMVSEMWRVLRVGGVFFARLASDIGLEDKVVRRRGRVHRLPDGSERFLVDEAYLLDIGASLGGELLDPIKTTNVQNLRAMTTWVLRKTAADTVG